MSGPRLGALHVYPVKSCGGVEVGATTVEPRGLKDDRRWMVVDGEGRFLSQRDHPRMCLVQPRLEGGELRLEAPGTEPLCLPRETEGPGTEVEVWGDRCRAIDLGGRAATWLGEVLGTECRLVRQADEAGRTLDPRYARSPDDPLSFADGFPFLLTSTSSLRDLNRRLARALPMDRFRPNLVVTGAEPWSEDDWSTIRIGEVDFTVAKPCARCSVTTVDQRTGEKGREPLRTLADFRRGEEGVEFGQNLVHHGMGVLESGTEIEVLDRW